MGKYPWFFEVLQREELVFFEAERMWKNWTTEMYASQTQFMQAMRNFSAIQV